MTRERFEHLLADQLSGEITAQDREELDRLVAADPALRAELAEYERQEVDLQRYYHLRAERAAVGPESIQSPAQPHVRRRRPLAWGLAAASLAAAFIGGLLLVQLDRTHRPMGGQALARVDALEGDVLVLMQGSVRALAIGDQLARSERVKVGGNGYLALRLGDGNIIEARGNTRFAIEEYHDRLAVQLDHGQLWAHLGRKPDKRFVIETDRLRATATGTVFGVQDGLAGSIVAVAEGSVSVESGSQVLALKAGEAWGNPAGPTALAQDSIDWSQYAGSLLALRSTATDPPDVPLEVAGASLATQELTSETGDAPTISDLADLLPVQTRFFLDLRDWPGIVREFQSSAYAMLAREQALQKWWTAIHGQDLVNEIEREIHLREILAVAGAVSGRCIVGVFPQHFLLLADCRHNESEVAAALGGAMVSLTDGNLEAVSRLRERMFVIDGRLVVSSSPQIAAEVIGRLASGEPSGFTEQPFYGKVTNAIQQPRLLAAADLASVVDQWLEQDPSARPFLDFSGLGGLETIVISPSFAGRGINQAARLSFRDRRYGMMNWLAEPAPMHGFGFFSSDVHLFAAAIIRSPREMFFDLLGKLIAENDQRAQAEARAFFESRPALFDSIGDEIVLGVDNPILPLPNVKLVVELASPARFALELDALLADWILRQAEVGTLAERRIETSSGIEIHTLFVDGWVIQPSWAYVDEFLVAGPGPRFVRHSIDVMRSGATIDRHPRLRNLLPTAGTPHFSLMVYQDIARAIPELLRTAMPANLRNQVAETFPDLTFLERFHAAGIAYAQAAPDRIDLYLNSPTGIDFNLGMAGPLVARWIAPHTPIGQQIDQLAEATVALEDLAAAALAFQATSGRLPASLAELTEAGLITLAPSDPFADGRPLRLVTGPAPGTILIYSIGPDGIDDQGLLTFDPAGPTTGEGDLTIMLPSPDGTPPRLLTPLTDGS